MLQCETLQHKWMNECVIKCQKCNWSWVVWNWLIHGGSRRFSYVLRQTSICILRFFFELRPALYRRRSARLKVIVHFYVHGNTGWILKKKKKKKHLVPNREQHPPLPCHTVHALIHNCLFLVSVMMLFTWPCSKPERQSVSPWKIKHADQKHFRFPLK